MSCSIVTLKGLQAECNPNAYTKGSDESLPLGGRGYLAVDTIKVTVIPDTIAIVTYMLCYLFTYLLTYLLTHAQSLLWPAFVAMTSVERQ